MTYKMSLQFVILGIFGSFSVGCGSKPLASNSNHDGSDGAAALDDARPKPADGPSASADQALAPRPDVARTDTIENSVPDMGSGPPDSARTTEDAAPRAPDISLIPTSPDLAPDRMPLLTYPDANVVPQIVLAPDAGSPGSIFDGALNPGSDAPLIFPDSGFIQNTDAPWFIGTTDAGGNSIVDNIDAGSVIFTPVQADGGIGYIGDVGSGYLLPTLPLGLMGANGTAGSDAGYACQINCIVGTKTCIGVSVGTCGGGGWDGGVAPGSRAADISVAAPCGNACSAGACVGTCAPGQRRCTAGRLESCTNEGAWVDQGPCPTCGALNPGGACPSPAYCAAAKCCEAILRPPLAIPNGVQGDPQNLIAGDFDGDGKTDLVFGRWDYYISPGFGFLKGRGDATFEAAKLVPTPAGFGSFYRSATADLNGDGKLDLITLPDGRNVATYLGTGSGTFTGPLGHSFNGYINSFVVAELNGDGKPDLAVIAGSFEGGGGVGLVWFAGAGDGTFKPGSVVNTECGYSHLLATDFNGDGKNELVTARISSSGTTLSVFKVQGGALVAAGEKSVSLNLQSFYAARLDGDAFSDLVLAFQDHVETLINDGGVIGAFKASNIVAANGGYNSSIAVGDVDGDGDGTNDIVVGLDNPGTLTVLRGHGDGSFVYQQAASTANLSSVNVADLNGDGRAEISVIGRLGFSVNQVLVFRTTLSCN